MTKFTSPAVGAITLNDFYFSSRIAANHSATIPASLRFSYDTGRIEAFELKWKKGMPKEPHVYWDSDVAKVVEGMAYDLTLNPDDKSLAAELDKIVSLIISAQQPDGYLNTHFTSVEPENRFKWLNWAHELYCCGHLIEAAVAHFQATGDRKFLDCMCRYADYVDSVFGRGKGKKRGYPGHEEIELALCKLAKVTGKKKYFKLAQYFIEERGRKPSYYVDNEDVKPAHLQGIQADITVRERKDAVGHAVRMMYLACGMAEVASETDDAELLERCDDIFKSVSEKRMFITGAVGSSRNGETFEHDYKLYNLEAYGESCASMGIIWFMQRMHNITGDGKYIEVLERALYNGALAGLSLSGDKFFYMNPLRSSVDSPYSRERVEWFGCSCCPTNYCRFLPQIGSFIWSENENEVRLNIPAASEYRSGGRTIKVSGGYPYDGSATVEFLSGGKFAFSMRIPSWGTKATVKVNGKAVSPKIVKGYATFNRTWKEGDTIELSLPMQAQLIRANKAIDDNAGKAAIVRGPLVYALESIDNGDLLHNIVVPSDAKFKATSASKLPSGTVALTCDALEISRPGDELYSATKPKTKKRKIKAIPYALWQNRGLSEMAVWLREK